jgi:TolA-binding protein
MRGNLSFIIVLLLAFVFANGLNAAKKQDDGYKVYQQAYNLILDEQWNEASNAFKDMLQRYPKSAWVDDASFICL